MLLAVETIKAMNPCKERFDNFLRHYPNFNGTIEDFVMLENITYQDKTWVLVRLMSYQQKIVFALECAISVLSVFEQKYPNDNRSRKALEAAQAYLANPTKENVAAAYAAAANAAYAAANAANAAADTAYAAAAAAAYAAVRGVEQQELNLIFAVEVLSA